MNNCKQKAHCEQEGLRMQYKGERECYYGNRMFLTQICERLPLYESITVKDAIEAESEFVVCGLD